MVAQVLLGLPSRRQKRVVVSTVLRGMPATTSAPRATRVETASIFLKFLLVLLGSDDLYLV